MDSDERSQRVRQAKQRLRAQRQRVGRLRGRIVVASLIGFLLLWVAVFVQMATGNDPVLGGSAATAVDSQRGNPHAAKVNLEAGLVETDPDTDSDDDDAGDIDSDDGDRTASAAASEGGGPEERRTKAIEPEPAAEAPAPVTTGQS